jgi:hypothetical protein
MIADGPSLDYLVRDDCSITILAETFNQIEFGMTTNLADAALNKIEPIS